MRLDLWVTTAALPSTPVADEAKAFMSRLKCVFLVENQQEYDLVFALQYMYGVEVTIFTKPQCSVGEVREYLRSFDVIFTSWDPLDRNRF